MTLVYFKKRKYNFYLVYFRTLFWLSACKGQVVYEGNIINAVNAVSLPKDV